MQQQPKTTEGKEDFSLVLGGPLYQLFLRTRLIRPPLDLLYRRVVASLLVTLLPLAVLTALGFWHAQNSLWDVVVHPVVMSEGALPATPLAMIGLATTVGIFAYTGDGAAGDFAGAMHGATGCVAPGSGPAQRQRS